VDYRIDHDDAGTNTLVIRGTAHAGGANYLKLGLSWDQDNRGTSEFGLRGSWRARGLNALGGEWYTTAQLGGNSEIATQFYQPLDKARHFFLDTRYSYSQRQLNLTDDGEIRGRALVDEQMLELAPGVLIGNLASLRAGAFAGTSEADIQIGPPEASSSNADLGGWFTELHIDTLDRAFFPRSGVRITSRYEESLDSLGADDSYDAWSTTAYGAWSHERSSVLLLARWSDLDLAAGSSALDLPGRAYSLGGFLNLSGYTRNSLAGTTLGMLNLAYYRRMNEQSFLPVDFPVYVGASLEAGNVWRDRHDASFDDLIHAGSVFLGVDSPIGPVYLGVGVGENNQRAFYLQVGQLFQ
jgi:NTE family protein